MTTTRAYRRFQEVKAKQRAKRTQIAKSLSAKDKLKLASTHAAVCSCHMCGNPRKFNKELTKQELKQLRSMAEAIAEL